MESRGTNVKIHDALDLVSMIEELLAQGKLSQATLNGIRVNMRLVKEAMQSAQAELSDGQPRVATPLSGPSVDIVASAPVAEESAPIMGDPDRIQMRRRDLRASIERIVDR